MHPKVGSLSLISGHFLENYCMYTVLTRLGEDPQKYKYGPSQPKTSSYAPTYFHTTLGECMVPKFYKPIQAWLANLQFLDQSLHDSGVL